MSERRKGVGHESFFWENQSWSLSSSGNKGKKLLGPSPNTRMAPESDLAPPIHKKPMQNSPQKCTEKKSCEPGNGGEDGGESDHEMHIWTERERRKKMRNLFSTLHSLLPHLSPKADKSTIVDEAINYIKTLESTLQTLQAQRLERLRGAFSNKDEPAKQTHQHPKLAFDSGEPSSPDRGSSTNRASRFPESFQTWTSPNVVLNICGDLGQFNVCAPNKGGVLAAICYVLERHKLEVVSAHVSSHHHRRMYMIQTHASGVPDQLLLESFPGEEVYKQAAGELMLLVSS